VNFIGEKNRDWLFNHLNEYHIMVQPSFYEGFGLTIVEGIASGLPVIASDIDGPAEILSEIPGGFLFPKGEFKFCANQILKVIGMYKEGQIQRAMKFSVSAVKAKYSIEVCTNKYMQEYNRVASA
jgi:glycosyltransferase involved in cell wall biosynthesis